MGFAKNFNYCMEQYGYSAYRFAKIIGANNQSVVNWLYGSNVPHPKTRRKIADHFRITLAELDGGVWRQGGYSGYRLCDWAGEQRVDAFYENGGRLRSFVFVDENGNETEYIAGEVRQK